MKTRATAKKSKHEVIAADGVVLGDPRRFYCTCTHTRRVTFTSTGATCDSCFRPIRGIVGRAMNLKPAVKP